MKVYWRLSAHDSWHEVREGFVGAGFDSRLRFAGSIMAYSKMKSIDIKITDEKFDQ
jgi:hypothetical protein